MTARPRKHADAARRGPLNVVAMAARTAAVPEPPAHLEGPECELWQALVETYTLDDAAALAVLATALDARARARSCREQIDREGQCVPDGNGTPKPHPLLAHENHARGMFLTGMKHLNLDIA